MTHKHAWLEAVRLRTLPVSAAGVIAAVGMAAASGYDIPWLWAVLCLIFALLAQIASNFANEYFDFRAGIDNSDRQGPQRGVANGIISPRAMLSASVATLALACCIGVFMMLRGGLWLLPVGVLIALGVFAYSAGPFPLSRRCLGEVAVILFYGLIPVCFTFYILTLTLHWSVAICGFGIGCWGAMVILVNNYRDIASDTAAGKHTLSTLLGPQGSALLYLALGQFAAASLWISGGAAWGVLPVIPAILGFAIGAVLNRGRLSGSQCTQLLAATALALLLTALTFLLTSLTPAK